MRQEIVLYRVKEKNMKGKYQFRYIETEEVLTEFLKVRGMTKISKNYRIVVFTGGVLILLFMLV